MERERFKKKKKVSVVESTTKDIQRIISEYFGQMGDIAKNHQIVVRL